MHLENYWPIDYLLFGIGAYIIFASKLAKAQHEIFTEEQKISNLESKVAELEAILANLRSKD
jgi:uncharacterized membrane protein YqhA